MARRNLIRYGGDLVYRQRNTNSSTIGCYPPPPPPPPSSSPCPCYSHRYTGRWMSTQMNVLVDSTKRESTLKPNLIQAPPLSNATILVDSLLQYTESLMDRQASNIIAYSGGVDSSLVAALVYRVFHHPTPTPSRLTSNSSFDNKSGSVRAVLGVSTSLPPSQLTLARSVAQHIGIILLEVPTQEGLDPTYVENKGQSCFICKNHLYSALEAVATQVDTLKKQSNHKMNQKILLFNGTNADDVQDPTRLGLLSAKAFEVKSPLEFTNKQDVRLASKHLGLPNWNYAASPCLRSRLAWGVKATKDHLLSVNKAEEKVRHILGLRVDHNLRVRMLTGQRAMIELDHRILSPDDQQNHGMIQKILHDHDMDNFLKELGFHGGFSIRTFASGAVSKPLR